MIPQAIHLLPGNATPLERALAASTLRLEEIPLPIDDVWRPDRCPAHLLPWLAWGLSVDLWDDTWPEAKKRYVCAQSFELHRLKGTIEGIRRHLGLVGASLKRAIRPPDQPFLGADLTDAERDAWLNRFPQIRIFEHRDDAPNSPEAFLGTGIAEFDLLYLGAGEDDDNVEDTFFCVETDAEARVGRRAFLWDQGPHPLATGEETPLRWLERTTVNKAISYYDHEQVLIPATDPHLVFCETMIFGDGASGEFFPTENTAGNRIVTINVERSSVIPDASFSKRTIGPSLQPINIWPERVAERGIAHAGVELFCGDRERFLDPVTKTHNSVECFLDGYLVENDAGLRLYDRLFLHDPARGEAAIDTTMYFGDCRLGMPAYHMELRVEVLGERKPWIFGEYLDESYLDEADNTALHRALDAIQTSMSGRDTIQVRTDLMQPISTRDRVSTRARHRVGGLIALN